MKTEPMHPPKDWQFMMPHPLANLSPFTDDVVPGLAEHMKVYGYDAGEPVIVYDDKALDGRHRLGGAVIAKVVPVFRKFVGTSAEALAYVRKKLHRQHLTPSQRAALETKIEAERLKSATPERSLNQQAQDADVARQTMQAAATVAANGTPALNAAVADGTASASDAAAIADQPAKEQNRRVKQLRGGKRKTLSESAPRRNGQPEYDPRDVTTLCSKLIAQADKLCLAYGEVDAVGKVIEGYSHKGLRQRVEEVRDFFERWQKQLMKKEKVK